MPFLPPNQQRQSTEGRQLYTLINKQCLSLGPRIEVRPITLPSLLTITVTCDRNFQYPTSYGHDPYACNKSRSEISWFKRYEWKQTDGRTRPIAVPCQLTRRSVTRGKHHPTISAVSVGSYVPVNCFTSIECNV